MSKASYFFSTKDTTSCSRKSASTTSPPHHWLQHFYPAFYKAWGVQCYLINSEIIGFTSARHFPPKLSFETVCWDFCQDLVESFHIWAVQLKCQSQRLFSVLRGNLKKSHTFLRVIFFAVLCQDYLSPHSGCHTPTITTITRL